MSENGSAMTMFSQQKKVRGEIVEVTDVDEPSNGNEIFAAATVAAVMEIEMPGKRWTLHELYDADRVCFTSCSLDSLSGEVTVQKAMFFPANSVDALHFQDVRVW
ncbi:hypothetical protein MRX96_039937 [Rhipicephalus microplus]